MNCSIEFFGKHNRKDLNFCHEDVLFMFSIFPFIGVLSWVVVVKINWTRKHSSKESYYPLFTIRGSLSEAGGGLCPGVSFWGVSLTEADRKWHPRTEWLTHACENITLSQTSFAGGKYIEILVMVVVFKMVFQWQRFWSKNYFYVEIIAPTIEGWTFVTRVIICSVPFSKVSSFKLFPF